MLLQMAGLAEALAALWALVRPLARVHALVFLQVSTVAEAPAAVRARVRFLPRVAALVDAEVGESVEVFPTQKANVPLVPALLSPPVFLEGEMLHEGVQSVRVVARRSCGEVCFILRRVELQMCAGEEGVLENGFQDGFFCTRIVQLFRFGFYFSGKQSVLPVVGWFLLETRLVFQCRRVRLMTA